MTEDEVCWMLGRQYRLGRNGIYTTNMRNVVLFHTSNEVVTGNDVDLDYGRGHELGEGFYLTANIDAAIKCWSEPFRRKRCSNVNVYITWKYLSITNYGSDFTANNGGQCVVKWNQELRYVCWYDFVSKSELEDFCSKHFMRLYVGEDERMCCEEPRG